MGLRLCAGFRGPVRHSSSGMLRLDPSGAATTVSWSSTLARAVKAGLVCFHEAAGVIVLSQDRSTRLQLDSSGSLANVAFPLACRTAGNGSGGLQTQMFPVSCLPSRWAHPLRLALAALELTSPCGRTQCKASVPQRTSCSVPRSRRS